MSLINDALKQARKAPPRNLPNALQPIPTASAESRVASWLLPALVIVLIVAAIFFMGWAVAHHTVGTIVAQPPAPEAAAPPAIILAPATPRPLVTPPPPPPPALPKLQGIFYSPTAPSAIIDGKEVRPGDKLGQYRVKSITKYTVILTGQDKKELKLGMGN